MIVPGGRHERVDTGRVAGLRGGGKKVAWSTAFVALAPVLATAVSAYRHL